MGRTKPPVTNVHSAESERANANDIPAGPQAAADVEHGQDHLPEEIMPTAQFLGGGRMGNYIGGLPDEDTICRMGNITDRTKLRKHKEFETALDAIRKYQILCRDIHTLEQFGAYKPKFIDEAYTALTEVISAIEGAANRYQRWFASRSSTMTGLMVGFSQVMVKATMMLPRFAAIRPETVMAYAAESGESEVSLDQLLSSPLFDQMGNQSVTLTNQAASDKAVAAYQGQKQGMDRDQLYSSMRQTETDSVRSRTLPRLEDSSFSAEINSLLAALDNMTLTGGDGESIANAKTPYFALIKLLMMVRDPLTADPDAVTKWQEIQGKTVAQAAVECQNRLFENAEHLGPKFDPTKHVTGGAVSKVLLDFDNSRILRTSAKGVNESTPDSMRQNIEKDARNSYYDEALSVMDRLFGSHVIADASVVRYEDHEGNTHFGSQMALAKGKEASKINFGLGSEEEYADVLLRTQDVKKSKETGATISTTDRPYYNLMDHPKMLGEILKLQVIDYVAASADRHANNFFLNPNAKEGEAMVTGIDNDRAFREANINQLTLYDLTRGEKQDNSANCKFGAYNAVTLQHGFKVITPEVKAMIERVSLDQLRDALRPYLNRVSLAIAVERLRTLQDYIKSSKVVDLNTPEGRDQYAAFLKENMFDTVASMMRFNDSKHAAGDVSVAERTGNLASNVLMDSFVDTYFVGQGGRQFNLKTILRALKKMGYTRTQLLSRMRERGRLKGAGNTLTDEEYQAYFNSPLFEELPE